MSSLSVVADKRPRLDPSLSQAAVASVAQESTATQLMWLAPYVISHLADIRDPDRSDEYDLNDRDIKVIEDMGSRFAEGMTDPSDLLHACRLLPNNLALRITEALLLDDPTLEEYKGVVDRRGGFSAFHHATRRGNKRVVDTLLKLGKDFFGPEGASTLKSRHGFNPLHVAVAEDNYALTRLLLERGFAPNSENNRGQTAAHMATTEAYQPPGVPFDRSHRLMPSYSCIALLYSADVNWHKRDHEGNSALDLAAMSGIPETWDELRDYARGVDFTVRRPDGRSLFDLVPSHCVYAESIVEELIRDCDPDFFSSSEESSGSNPGSPVNSSETDEDDATSPRSLPLDHSPSDSE